jgi:hypothetical protein
MDDLDLEKIAEFMNAEPETEDTNTNEIEDTIDYIDTQLAEVKKGTKEITSVEDVKKQETTIEDLTKIALTQFSKLDKNTDDIFELFYKPISLRQDRSDASKEALVESQRLKVEMINALAGLANAKAKLELARQKQTSGPAGIYVQAQNGADVGISLHNLWEETK